MRLYLRRRPNIGMATRLAYIAGALILALAVVGAIFAAFGLSVFGTYSAMLRASFIGSGAFSQTLANSAPLIFTGLCVAWVFPMRVYNVGGEGQLYLGAVAASGVALWLDHAPTAALIPAMILAGVLGGAAWVALPAILRATLRTNEIVTTLMLNYLGGLLITYLIFNSNSFWRDTAPNITYPAPKIIPAAADWPTIGLGAVQVPVAWAIGIVLAGLMFVAFRHSRLGFERRVLSFSPAAARYMGVSARRIVLTGALVSGALAGVAGATEVGTVAHTLDPVGLQAAQYGYTGIVVAALAAFEPLAVLPAALFLGGVVNSGVALQSQGFPSGLVGTMEGVILLAVTSAGFFVAYEIRVQRRGRRAGHESKGWSLPAAAKPGQAGAAMEQVEEG